MKRWWRSYCRQSLLRIRETPFRRTIPGTDASEEGLAAGDVIPLLDAVGSEVGRETEIVLMRRTEENHG